jgi:predicted RNA-binding protein with PUA-like domain
MKMGDLVLFYHSSCPQPGIAGVARVASKPMPDKTQFEPGDYFDAKSTPEKPIWICVEVAFVKKCELIPLAALREAKHLESMRILQRGNRLSITPVSRAEWTYIEKNLLK